MEARGYAWLPDAVHHPALFHATMLCAAVHLQRIQPRKLNNPQVPLWLKTETLRLLNETLETTSEGPSDDIILTTLILLYWNVSSLPVLQFAQSTHVIRTKGARWQHERIRNTSTGHQQDVEASWRNIESGGERNCKKLAFQLLWSVE